MGCSDQSWDAATSHVMQRAVMGRSERSWDAATSHGTQRPVMGHSDQSWDAAHSHGTQRPVMGRTVPVMGCSEQSLAARFRTWDAATSHGTQRPVMGRSDQSWDTPHATRVAHKQAESGRGGRGRTVLSDPMRLRHTAHGMLQTNKQSLRLTLPPPLRPSWRRLLSATTSLRQGAGGEAPSPPYDTASPGPATSSTCRGSP